MCTRRMSAASHADCVTDIVGTQVYPSRLHVRACNGRVRSVFGGRSINRPSRLLIWIDFWQGQRDSNPRPTVLETVALPAELYPYQTRRHHRAPAGKPLSTLPFRGKRHPAQRHNPPARTAWHLMAVHGAGAVVHVTALTLWRALAAAAAMCRRRGRAHQQRERKGHNPHGHLRSHPHKIQSEDRSRKLRARPRFYFCG